MTDAIQADLFAPTTDAETVAGEFVCIVCQAKGKISAHVRAAWVRCPECKLNVAMFLYRGKNSKLGEVD